MMHDEPKRTPEMREVMERLSKAIVTIEENMNSLESRLIPVLRQEPLPNQPDKSSINKEFSSPLASEIISFVYKLEVIHGQLSFLRNLLEI